MSTTAERQRELEDLVQAYQRQADPSLSLSLFRVLGWDGGEYRLEPGRVDGSRQQYRLNVAGETTAYLFIAPEEPHDDLIRTAANVAYNSGIDWAAVTNFGTTKLVHARWSDNPTYITLKSTDYARRLRELELLSPQSMVDGRLSEDAQVAQRERQVLRPIDQHLMSRLESWRRLLLRNSRDATDEQVHELIGRLFFIRSCEDRNIIPGESLLALRSQDSAERPLGLTLQQLFARLSADFNSELFIDGDDRPPSFDDGVLAEIIQQLYSPFPGLPQYRYDFSYLNVDVLGKVYERYVSTVLERVAHEESQLSFFDTETPSQEIEIRSRRREQGIFYTPPYMVNYIVQHTVERLLAESASVDSFPRVADISCGSGAFLTRAAERMAARAREIDQETAASSWRGRVISRLIGVDVDQRAVTLARVNLWILTTMGEPPRPLPELGASVFAADALVAPELDALEGTLDAVIGNPPFRPAAELNRTTQERLRRRYGSATGRFDLAYVFMERALRLVRPGGYVGLVLPNRLFTNADARFLRDLLVDTATIEHVVDFGHERAFDEGTSYIAMLIVRKRTAPAEAGGIGAIAPGEGARVRVHQVLRRAEYPGLQLRRADLLDGKDWRDDYSHIFTTAQPSGSGPWIWWATSVEDRIRRKLAAESMPLSSVALLRQGVKTGDNRIFLLKRIGTNARAGRWIMRNGLGQRLELEPDLLRPCVHGGNIGRYVIRQDEAGRALDYILYPYQDGRLLDLFDLQAMFPATHAYLMECRDRLAGRSTVARGGAWYGLSWARAAEGWLDRPKLLTRDLVPEATFAVDEEGHYVPVGGTAILPQDETRISLNVLLGVLNSSVMTWYLSHRATRFQNGYLRMIPGEIKAFHFPWGSLLTESALTRRLAALAAGAAQSTRLGLPTTDAIGEIDAILFDVLGLDADEQQAIRDRTTRGPDEQGDDTPRLFPLDVSPTQNERLALVDRLLGLAESADSRRAREEALIRVRDEILAGLRESDGRTPPLTISLLTFALIGADRLSGTAASYRQVALLRELIRTSGDERIEPAALATYERRLREAGIDVMPGMAGASVAMAVDYDEARDESLVPEA